MSCSKLPLSLLARILLVSNVVCSKPDRQVCCSLHHDSSNVKPEKMLDGTRLKTLAMRLSRRSLGSYAQVWRAQSTAAHTHTVQLQETPMTLHMPV